MARRRRSREEVSHDRWVVSYADFITLLLAFFVVMYAISSVNEGKYRVLSQTLTGIFAGPERSRQPIQIGDLPRPDLQRDIGLLDQAPSIPAAAPEPQDEELARISEEASSRFQELIADGRISVSRSRHWVEIEIGSGLLFAPGSAEPLPGALEVLEEVAQMLAPYPNPVLVEGHTDDQPISTARFPSNWELSAARAAAVVRVMAHYGVAGPRLAAVGFGEFRPKVSNRTPRGRELNRRVKIVVVRDEVAGRQLLGREGLPDQGPEPSTRVKPVRTDEGLRFVPVPATADDEVEQERP